MIVTVLCGRLTDAAVNMKINPIKISLRTVVRDVLAAGRAGSVYLADIQNDFLAPIFDGQRPGHPQHVSVSSPLYFRALKTNFRIAIRIEEICSTQERVPSLVTCLDAGRLQHDCCRRVADLSWVKHSVSLEFG